MSAPVINTADDVYRFIDRLKAESEKQGITGLTTELDDALPLGSSGLEILGAIRLAVINNVDVIKRLLGSTGENQAKQVVAFVDKTFGR